MISASVGVAENLSSPDGGVAWGTVRFTVTVWGVSNGSGCWGVRFADVEASGGKETLMVSAPISPCSGSRICVAITTHVTACNGQQTGR